MRKFADIIERIEYVRKYLNLNKSRFSGEIGMKPQTYNNFIGAQGSKPNIELIHGIVNKFGVHPIWLLNGTGDVFSGRPGEGTAGGIYDGSGQVAESEMDPHLRQLSSSLNELYLQLQTLDPVISEAEKRIKELETSQLPLINGLTKVLERYVELDPVGATREMKAFIQKLGLRLKKTR
ncbi:MAG: helix-turn-helix transcriptional regulator [SAR324 cluster bacterium]|nr:helix-turn-helix transcriptional regulator [SAR324 cluster bacterium]